MPEYSNGKIYKITNNVNDYIYIGSTIKTLKERFNKHKSDYKFYLNENNRKVSSFKLFNTHGIENCAIELIELYPCDNRTELEQQESVYINKNKEFCVNNNIPGRTDKQYREYQNEYRIDNADKMKEYQNEYRDNNKDKLNNKNICGCGGKFTNRNKSMHYKSKKHLNYLEKQPIININNLIINNYN